MMIKCLCEVRVGGLKLVVDVGGMEVERKMVDMKVDEGEGCGGKK